MNGHPVLGGQLSMSQICFPLITVLFTSIKRFVHPLFSHNGLFLLSSTCIKRSLKVGVFKYTQECSFKLFFNPCFSPKIKLTGIFEPDSKH